MCVCVCVCVRMCVCVCVCVPGWLAAWLAACLPVAAALFSLIPRKQSVQTICHLQPGAFLCVAPWTATHSMGGAACVLVGHSLGAPVAAATALAAAATEASSLNAAVASFLCSYSDTPRSSTTSFSGHPLRHPFATAPVVSPPPPPPHVRRRRERLEGAQSYPPESREWLTPPQLSRSAFALKSRLLEGWAPFWLLQIDTAVTVFPHPQVT